MLEQIQALILTRDGIGKALTQEQQVFVSANVLKMHEFVATNEGRAAVALFVEEWQRSLAV